jgi:hypothetical protein
VRVSLQLGVLGLGLLQGGDVGIGVFPEGDEILVTWLGGLPADGAAKPANWAAWLFRGYAT